MKFSLRPLTENDLDNLVRHANNAKIADNLTNKFPHPYGEQDGRNFIDFVKTSEPPHVLAIDIEGEFVGAIGVHPQDDIMRKNAEMGYWLAEPYWGKGIITEAIKRMVKYGFENFSVNRIFARPFGSNKGSQRVLEKAGFTLEGRFAKTIYKNGRYEDELFYAVRRGEDEK